MEDKHRDDKAELQNLILSKEEEHSAQLEEREQIIAKLQETITETSESAIRLRNEIDANNKTLLKEICDKHDKEIKEIKESLQKTQEESASFANENFQLKKNVDVLLGKNETLEDMRDIQTEEIERLRGLPDEKQKFLNTQQQVKSMSTSVDQLKLELDARLSENI